MQGSFTADSANKFLQLMAEEGYDVNSLSSPGELENFSGGANNKIDAWDGKFPDFSNLPGEYVDPQDFLEKGHDISAHKDTVGQVMHRWKHHDPRPLHSGVGKGGKEGKVVKSQDQAIAIALSMAGKSKKEKRSDHSERSMLEEYSEKLEERIAELSEDGYDYTRCERPNGTVYGTSGQCRKGKETAELFAPDGGSTTSVSGGRIGGALFGRGNIATTPGQDRVAELVKSVQDKDGVFRKLVWPSTKLTPELKKKLEDLYETIKAERESLVTEVRELRNEKEGFLIKKPKDNSKKISEMIEQVYALDEAARAIKKKLRQPKKEQTRDLSFAELDGGECESQDKNQKKVIDFKEPLKVHGISENLSALSMDELLEFIERPFSFEDEDQLDFARCERKNGTAYGTAGQCRKGFQRDLNYPYAAAVTQGRFNIPHKGHAKLIKKMLEKAPVAYVVLGTGTKNVNRDFRSQMLRAMLRKEGVDLSRVRIMQGTHINVVNKQLSEKEGAKNVVVMLGEDQKNWLKSIGKEAGVRTQVIPRSAEGASSSAIRKMVDSNDEAALKKEFDNDPYLIRLAKVARKVEKNEFSEFDFTRCERPDGSAYGTKGKCRKGTEAEKEEMDVIQQLASMLPKGESIMDSTGKIHKVGGRKPVSLDEQIKEAYAKEQKARGEGDQETARKYMREHMRLAAEMDAQAKKQAGKKITPEEYHRMLQQDLIRLPDGRVARRNEIRSPYEI